MKKQTDAARLLKTKINIHSVWSVPRKSFASHLNCLPCHLPAWLLTHANHRAPTALAQTTGGNVGNSTENDLAQVSVMSPTHCVT